MLLEYDLATWLKIAIAAVAGAVLFAAVSVAVTGALTALAAATGAAYGPVALAVISGCIGGLAAGPAAMAIATDGNLTTTSGLASALVGCFAGTTVSAALGLKWIAAVLQQLGWTTASTAVTTMIGQAGVADAAAAGFSLTPVQTQLAALSSSIGFPR